MEIESDNSTLQVFCFNLEFIKFVGVKTTAFYFMSRFFARLLQVCFISGIINRRNFATPFRSFSTGIMFSNILSFVSGNEET